MKATKINRVTVLTMTESEFLEAIEEVGLDFLVEVEKSIVPIYVVSDDE